MLKTKVEQSGQHVLIGNGEMHLDCILHDIRLLYSDIQARISDPSVTFAETVIQTSGIPCYADTPNKKNRVLLRLFRLKHQPDLLKKVSVIRLRKSLSIFLIIQLCLLSSRLNITGMSSLPIMFGHSVLNTMALTYQLMILWLVLLPIKML